jgi:hypothetical protein
VKLNLKLRPKKDLALKEKIRSIYFSLEMGKWPHRWTSLKISCSRPKAPLSKVQSKKFGLTSEAVKEARPSD